MNLAKELAPLRQRIIDRLDAALPDAECTPQKLHAAMRHSAQLPGKCIRGCLVYASGRALGIAAARLDRLACALELVHAYSLVHDDLPCMDDDDERRGRPACHIAYGEATAVLAGNALLLCALNEILDDATLTGTQRAMAAKRLCTATGAAGMIGGQQMDLDLETLPECDIAWLDAVYRHKTASLLHAAVMLPTEYLENPPEQARALDAYGWKIGLAFQIRDDLQDIRQDARAGADASAPTSPSLLGVAQSRQRLTELATDAQAELEKFDARADLLRGIAQWLAG